MQKEKPVPAWQNPKFISIASVIISGLLIYYLSALAQYTVFSVIYKADMSLIPEGIAISVIFNSNVHLSIFQMSMFIALPYLVAVVLIEIINVLVRLTDKDVVKTFLLFAQLSLFSFFLFSLLLFILSLVFSLHFVESWYMLITRLNADYQKKLIIGFCVTIVFFGYFAAVLGRLKNYFQNLEPNDIQRTPHGKSKK